MAAVFALRARVFRADPQADDRDRFDETCAHFLVRDRGTGAAVGSFRLLHLPDGSRIETSYSAQFYDLTRLAAYPEPVLEVGRFCVDPVARHPDILRAAWALMTRYVDGNAIGLMFGCTSFQGTRVADYHQSFAYLRQNHLAPEVWKPLVKAGDVHRFGEMPDCGQVDLKQAIKGLPPLLRTYLAMGGWVSDHAVIDRDLDTIHVFTGVEVKSVPPARARMLRALS